MILFSIEWFAWYLNVNPGIAHLVLILVLGYDSGCVCCITLSREMFFVSSGKLSFHLSCHQTFPQHGHRAIPLLTFNLYTFTWRLYDTLLLRYHRPWQKLITTCSATESLARNYLFRYQGTSGTMERRKLQFTFPPMQLSD